MNALAQNNGLLRNNSMPAVVFACERHVGLGIMRSLGRLGVDVYGVGVERNTPALLSKYCRQSFIWDFYGSKREDSLNFLNDIGETIGQPALLIPTGDVPAMFVAENAEILRKRFIFPDQDPAMLLSLSNKKQMYYLARRYNIPTPETSFPDCRQDVLEYLRTARFPLMVKPIYNRQPNRAAKLWPITIVRTREQLLELYDTIEDPSMPNLMLQEYIPSDEDAVWMFNGYFDSHGDCRVAFTGKKLRQFRPYRGHTSLGVCIRNDYVLNTTIQFMKEIGYKGILDLGYRYDSRDKKYKIFDINPRIGGTFRLFVDDNGMDVVRALYQDMSGQSVIPAGTKEGRKWIIEDVDLLSSIRYYRDGNLSFRGWINSLRGIDEGAYMSSDDLWPIAGICMIDAKRAFTSAWKLFRAPTSPGVRERPAY
jgi:D-aspartate ligase